MTISLFDEDVVEVDEPIPEVVDVRELLETAEANEDASSVDVDEHGAMPNMDYRTLANRPQVEGNELIGDKKFSDLGLQALTNVEIKRLLERRA